ncbi:MAG: DUF333 domain-containing protein [Chloroflexi bacterium]|nr:DUF333 domain-containing protein [Chloroflexota bacterium]
MRTTRLPFLTILLLAAMIASGCAAQQPPSPTATPTDANTGIANPASVYCTEKGYSLEIRTAADGSQYGACIFPDGSECEEWAYFRGECSQGESGPKVTTPVSTGEGDLAVEAVRTFLASGLSIDPSAISLISVEAVTWSDACLGLGTAAEACAQVQTPGYRIIVQTPNGQPSTFRTDLTGSSIRPETSGTSGG